MDLMRKTKVIKKIILVSFPFSVASIAVACSNPSVDRQIDKWSEELAYQNEWTTTMSGYVGSISENYNISIAELNSGETKKGVDDSLRSQIQTVYNLTLKKVNELLKKYQGKINIPNGLENKISELTKMINEIPLSNSYDEARTYFDKVYVVLQEFRTLAQQMHYL
ncbi:hypothetical protein CJJ23_03075 [Mycoplasmopsis agassizii]|uniref:Lipoprotein n=2 Tax=Mycoplasmopsis agassizii TaxID=33922 RepID=A0A269TIC1_9BACT|nr:hypothetical protein CJJ23_03075 [Mycoplasmopsis agassizii]